MSSFPIPFTEQQAQTAFDYSVLPTAQAECVERMAVRIRALEDVARKQVETSAIEIGRALIEVKAILNAGQFGKWLTAEFGWTDRTARNCMSAARLVDEKSEIVSVLPPTALYKLASPTTPETCVDEVIQRIEAGEKMSAKAIGNLVAEARRHAENEKAMDKKLKRKLRGALPEKHDQIRKNDERHRHAVERENRKDAERQKLRKQANEDAVALLRHHLGPDFPRFVALFEAGFVWGFAEALKAELSNDEGGDA